MSDRVRKNRIEIKVTEEEKEMFVEKLRLSKIKNMSLFIRKSILEKEIFVVDMSEIRKIYTLLSISSNNINQIAKHVNSKGEIYKKDIEEVKKSIKNIEEKLYKIENNIYKNLSKRRE